MSEKEIPYATLSPETAQNHQPTELSGIAKYNLITDTVTGVNVRWKDNLFQAVFVFVVVIFTSFTGAILVLQNKRWELPWYMGATFGLLTGLILSVLFSGFFLMVYRAARHLNRNHD